MVADLKLYGCDNSKLVETIIESSDDAIKDLILIDIESFISKFIDSLETDELIINRTKKYNDDTKLYREFNGAFYYNNVVGVIKKKKYRIFKHNFYEINLNEADEEYELNIVLQIKSRFDLLNNGNKPFFLTTMMMKLHGTPNNNMVPSNDDQFFDFLLLYVFKQKLANAYHKGYFRTYHKFENNDSSVKGTIDIARHLKMNMNLNNGKIAYSYREKTIDNYFNHLIIEAYQHLKKKYFDLIVENIDRDKFFSEIIYKLKTMINYPKYDKRVLVSKNLRPKSHPYYFEYEDLRKICIKILRNNGLSVFDGDSDEVSGLLFYIPELWERYLLDYLYDVNYYTEAQDELKIFDYLDDKYRKKTYPDYVFYCEKDVKPFMILDAKFKPDWGEVIKLSSSISESLLPDYDKCIRDMNTINAHATGVIFPTNEQFDYGNPSFVSHNISKYNQVDMFYTFPIYVPKVDCEYRKWYENFSMQCKKASRFIKEIIVREKELSNRIDGISDMILNERKK